MIFQISPKLSVARDLSQTYWQTIMFLGLENSNMLSKFFREQRALPWQSNLPYILSYKSLPRISRSHKNWVHMLSKIIDPCISRRYSKLTTCYIIVRILGGFYDAQRKCSITRRSLSLSHFRQMWLQPTRPTRPAIGADIMWHTGVLVAAKPVTAAAGVLY